MKSARENPQPFKVIAAKGLLKQCENGLAGFFRKSVVNKGNKFTIQKYCVLNYCNATARYVQCSQSYVPVYETFDLKLKGRQIPETLDLQLSDPGIVKKAKIKDVRDLLKYMNPKPKQWLSGILDEAEAYLNSLDDETSSDDASAEED